MNGRADVFVETSRVPLENLFRKPSEQDRNRRDKQQSNSRPSREVRGPAAIDAQLRPKPHATDLPSARSFLEGRRSWLGAETNNG